MAGAASIEPRSAEIPEHRPSTGPELFHPHPTTDQNRGYAAGRSIYPTLFSLSSSLPLLKPIQSFK